MNVEMSRGELYFTLRINDIFVGHTAKSEPFTQVLMSVLMKDKTVPISTTPTTSLSFSPYKGTQQVSLYALNGQKIYSASLSYAQIKGTMQSLNLSRGIYFVQGLGFREKIAVR